MVFKITERTEMKHKKHIFAALAASLLLAGCGKSPESTIESFYKAIAKGEVSEAKGYLSSKLTAQLGDAKLSAALTSEAQRLSACGGVKSVEAKLQGEGEVRTGTVAISFVNDATCKQQNQRTSLVKENGSWKISPGK